VEESPAKKPGSLLLIFYLSKSCPPDRWFANNTIQVDIESPERAYEASSIFVRQAHTCFVKSVEEKIENFFLNTLYKTGMSLPHKN
jgi:hypothetical protein